MKKVWKITKKVFIGILVTILVAFVGMWSFDQIATRSDNKYIAQHAYGEKIEVRGKMMNVAISGQGDQTIVLLPGWGTPSPVIDFKPVIQGLEDSYRVIAVEPFGYGLSDLTQDERTMDAIITELHEALQVLEVDEFIFMGHSIAGLYGINYVNKYPGEVRAFVGIDTSVGGQFTADMPTGMFSFMKNSGFMRLTSLFGEPTNMSEGLTPDELKLMGRISNVKSLNKTMLDELKHLGDHLELSEKLSFPSDVPVYLFVQEINPNQPDWISLHEKQASNSEYSGMTLIDGDHYLHHKNSGQIVSETKAFLESLR